MIAPKAEDRLTPESSEMSDILRALVEGNPMTWLDRYGVIHTKKVNQHDPDYSGTKLWRFQANPLQQRLAEVVDYMLEKQLPVRLLIYKPRQKGSSTGSMGIADWFIKRFGHNGYLCGNSLDNCDNLFGILRTYNEHDGYDWGFSTDIQAKIGVYGNGGRFKWATAKNAESGRSAQIGVLVMTEIARWAEDDGKVRDAGKVFSSLMGGVPKEPNTLVIGETTVRGASGVFYEQWQAAKTFEQLKVGDYEYGDFIKVFMPWYVFSDSVLATTPEEDSRIRSGRDALNDTERATEANLLNRYKLSPGHIKYFRMRLKECDYDPEERDREEPTTEESGFYASQPCYFAKAQLQAMRQWAERQQGEIRKGVLEWGDAKKRSGVAFVPVNDDERPLWQVLERPDIGRRYSIGVDNSRGDAHNKDSDCHAVVVLREGYFDKTNACWMPPRVVATLRPGCRIDIDLLAEEVVKLAVWYGRCLVIPEANNDCGLIRELRKFGAHIYNRERPATDKDDQQPTGKLGFWTSDDGSGQGLRSEILAEVRSTVRKRALENAEGLEIPFLHILDEMEHFAINSNTGKAEALEGHHDDFVMSLAFAFYLRARGSVMAPPAGEGVVPPDVLAMMRMVDAQRPLANGAHRV